MASLRDAVQDNAAELRDGIPWVVFWRDGRSWNSEAVFFSMDYATDTIAPDDIGRLQYINETDPRAVALNGYYCGHLGEDMTIDELTRGVRWHYENNYNTLAAFIEEYKPALPPAQLEAAREAAHAAGLPFSERPYDGRDFDPYIYDGSMTPEDYELMQNNITQERSDDYTMAENENTVAQQNYRALTELAPGIMHGTYSYMRFQAGDAFMPLTFEHLYDDRYSLMHFYTQNGDLMRDPDMEIVINHEAQTVEAMTFTQHPFIFQEVEQGDTRLQQELNGFLSQWLSNIKAQEYTPERAIQYDRDGNRQEVTFNEPQPDPDLSGGVLSIQIHNRVRFEQGEPGEWLKLPATAEQLHAAMLAIGITAENRQDFFINGIDSPIAAVQRLPFEQVQAATVDELNYLAARLEQLEPAQIEKLNVNGDILSYWNDVHHLTEYVQNTEFFMYIPGITDHSALGDYYLNKSDLVQMPEGWKAAVDVEQLGQLAAEQEKGILWDNGYILETGDEWQPVNEIPQQYQIMSFPQPELTAEEAAALADGRDAALRDIDDEQLEPPTPFDMGGDPPIEYDAIATRAPAVATVQPPELVVDTEPQQSQPVKPITLESEKPADKLKEITDKLESGIAGIFESEQYKDYLKTLSKFHDYSLNNTILIAMQKPDASLVAGFSSWKKQFERNVRKGEKGIKIIAPSPYKVKVQQEKTDPATGKPVIGADGKPVTEETERKIPAYKVVSVFDVSQTEGKELPTIGVDILTGDVEQYKDFYAALEKASPVPIAFENIEGSANGYYHQEDKRIAIDEGMSELQTLKTTIHEIAHARLHDIDKGKEQGEDEPPRADRRTREVEAESVAYTVCQHYGLDTSDYSFAYVAGWSSGKELTELKASLETIRTTAAELITEIDGHFAQLQQDRAQTAAHEQQPGFEEWSEPATAANAPDNPGEPSDDINAYIPQAAPEQERQQGDTYAIYQLKADERTRDYRFEPYDHLQAAGLTVDPQNYTLVYSGQLATGETLDNIFEKFNISRPADFTGHSLSMSDVVTLNQGGKETAHYVDRFGFKDVPEFLHPAPTIEMQQAAAIATEPDNFLTGEQIKTPRGSFSLTDMTTEQMNAAGYGFHHSSDDGKYHIMGNGTRAFAIANPLRTAEMSTEQNMNMIDGIPNNTPSVAELEAKVKAGEQINLSDLAAAIKAERGGTDRDTDKKPSIREQLRAGREQTERSKPAPDKAKDKNNHLEV